MVLLIYLFVVLIAGFAAVMIASAWILAFFRAKGDHERKELIAVGWVYVVVLAASLYGIKLLGG